MSALLGWYAPNVTLIFIIESMYSFDYHFLNMVAATSHLWLKTIMEKLRHPMNHLSVRYILPTPIFQYFNDHPYNMKHPPTRTDQL